MTNLLEAHCPPEPDLHYTCCTLIYSGTSWYIHKLFLI